MYTNSETYICADFTLIFLDSAGAAVDAALNAKLTATSTGYITFD